MKSIVKVKRNQWGNYVCYIGRERDMDYGKEVDSVDWLSDKLDAGHLISKASDITLHDVNQWRIKIGLAPIEE